MVVTSKDKGKQITIEEPVEELATVGPLYHEFKGLPQHSLVLQLITLEGITLEALREQQLAIDATFIDRFATCLENEQRSPSLLKGLYSRARRFSSHYPLKSNRWEIDIGKIIHPRVHFSSDLLCWLAMQYSPKNRMKVSHQGTPIFFILCEIFRNAFGLKVSSREINSQHLGRMGRMFMQFGSYNHLFQTSSCIMEPL